MLPLLASLAAATPLPPPEDDVADADYRRIVGVGAAVFGGADTSGAPGATAVAELWIAEALTFGVGARYGPAVRYDGVEGTALSPALTWGFRLVSIHRALSLDVVGRHAFLAGTTWGGVGGQVEYRLGGPHAVRVTALGGFDGNVTLDAGYTLRWER